jgi:hypothetical protein
MKLSVVRAMIAVGLILLLDTLNNVWRMTGEALAAQWITLPPPLADYKSFITPSRPPPFVRLNLCDYFSLKLALLNNVMWSDTFINATLAIFE